RAARRLAESHVDALAPFAPGDPDRAGADIHDTRTLDPVASGLVDGTMRRAASIVPAVVTGTVTIVDAIMAAKLHADTDAGMASAIIEIKPLGLGRRRNGGNGAQTDPGGKGSRSEPADHRCSPCRSS